MELTGDGLWDWVSANMDAFTTSITKDVASTLGIAEDKISDVVAKLQSSLLLHTRTAAVDLLASQVVDVTFVIQQGASNALTPAQLATAYQSAVSNGTADFSSTEKASGIKVTAKVTDTNGPAPATTGGMAMPILAAIAVGGLCFIVLAICLVKKYCCKGGGGTEKTEQSKGKQYSGDL